MASFIAALKRRHVFRVAQLATRWGVLEELLPIDLCPFMAVSRPPLTVNMHGNA